MYCYGIDLGGTTTKIGLFDADGELLEKWEIPTRVETDLNTILQDIADALQNKLNERQIDQKELIGIGIGIAGPVEENGHTMGCVNLNIYDFNPSVDLAQLVGVPVYTANDANIAALGELWHGGGKGYQSALFVTLGTGVGSGVIIDGKIIYGSKGLSGEIGHISVNPDEPLICNCGNRGCLDQMASATGVVRNAKRYLEKYPDKKSVLRENADSTAEDFTAEDVFKAAQNGDEAAADTIDYCYSFFGKMLADVSHIVDPDVFIIGGGVSKAGQYLIDVTKKHYQKHLHLNKTMPHFSLAELGNDAGIYGGAKLVLQHK